MFCTLSSLLKLALVALIIGFLIGLSLGLEVASTSADTATLQSFAPARNTICGLSQDVSAEYSITAWAVCLPAVLRGFP